MHIRIIYISVQGKSFGTFKIMRRLKGFIGLHCITFQIEIIWQKQEKKWRPVAYEPGDRTRQSMQRPNATVEDTWTRMIPLCVKITRFDRNTFKTNANQIYLGSFIMLTEIFQYVDFCVSLRGYSMHWSVTLTLTLKARDLTGIAYAYL